MTRTFKRLVCGGLMGLMLFAQLAIAAYACPALSTTGAQGQTIAATETIVHQAPRGEDMVAMGVDASGDRMPNCDQMAGQLDEASPNLCAEHCRFGQQSDKVHVFATPAVVLISLYFVPPTLSETLLPLAATAAPSVDALAAASPPHAILHCCLRT